MRLVRGARPSKEVRLPPGYVLDRSDPDVLVLRCPPRDGGSPLQRPGRCG